MLLGVAAAFGQEPAGEPLATLTTSGVLIRHAPGQRVLAIEYAETFAAARRRVEAVTGAPIDRPVEIVIVADGASLRDRVRLAVGAEVPEWVAGVALDRPEQIIVRGDLHGPRSDRIEGLLTHELAHVAVHRILSGAGAAPLPRWFDEGVAQLAEGRPFVDDAPDLAARAFFRVLVPLGEIDGAFARSEGGSRLAYAEAESFVRFLVQEGRGRPVVAEVLRAAAGGATLDEALRGSLLIGLDALEERWQADLRGDRGWVLGFLGQILFAGGIVVAVVFGATRIVRRRAAAEARWREGGGEPVETLEDTEPAEEEEAPESRRPAAPPLRKLPRGEEAPPV